MIFKLHIYLLNPSYPSDTCRSWAVRRNPKLNAFMKLISLFLVHAFDAWSGRLTKSMPLTCLNDSVIGIDATYYLESLLAPPAKEPLLSALGGYPLVLESTIVKQLHDLQSAGFKPHFVFDGLDFGIKDDPFGPSIASARANAVAFDTYERDLAAEAIDTFRTSGQLREQNRVQLLIEMKVPQLRQLCPNF